MKQTLDWNAYLKKAAEAVAEGVVMLKNDNAALPLLQNEEIAMFGRIQLHYYKSGTGSGGMVNVSKVTGIPEDLQDRGVRLYAPLLEAYQKWDEENPYDMGNGWGGEPWCQAEMPLDEALVADAAAACERAVVVIGRTAGEEQDNHIGAGSYLLTDGETEMLRLCRKHFKKVIVLLNTGNIIDMHFVDTYTPDAVLYLWQGGMTGGPNGLKWKYFDPAKAPKQEFWKPWSQDRKYCSEQLDWIEEEWTFDNSESNSSGFKGLSAAIYDNYYDVIVNGAEREIKLDQVRRQVYVMEEAHRQNPLTKTLLP
mgnify:CR=1 FL=1